MLITITATICFVLGFLSCFIPLYFLVIIQKKESKAIEIEEHKGKKEAENIEKKQIIESQNILKEWLLGGE